MTLMIPEMNDLQVSAPEKFTESTVPAGYPENRGENRNVFSGIRLFLAEIKMRLRIVTLTMRSYQSPVIWIKVLKTLDRNRRAYLGNSRIRKLAGTSRRFYLDLYIPA